MRYARLLIVVLLFIGCKIKPDGRDSQGYYHYIKVCVKSHQETYMQPVPVGKVIMLQPREQTICDEYAAVKEYIPVDNLDLEP